MPYYCTVPRCTSMAGKAKNVSFHQFPRDEELARLWNDILKRGKPYTKYSKVCSLHFKPEDYTITSVGKNKGQWRTLRKDAVPSQNLPSETPAPYSRKQWESWSQNSGTPVMDPSIHQQVAQAIYMQTMLAMQAAGNTEPLQHNGPILPDTPHSSNHEDILKGKHTNTDTTSYKCTDCTKCFKDPDVFILHKRTHTKEKTNGMEKENFNMNLTLRSNPILANLLKTNSEANFDPSIVTMENLLMTALAANIDYLRNFSTKDGDCDENRDRIDLNDERIDLNHDRIDSNNRIDVSCDRIDSNRGRIVSNRDRIDVNRDRIDINHDNSENNAIVDLNRLKSELNYRSVELHSKSDQDLLKDRNCKNLNYVISGSIDRTDINDECLNLNRKGEINVRSDLTYSRSEENHSSGENHDLSSTGEVNCLSGPLSYAIDFTSKEFGERSYGNYYKKNFDCKVNAEKNNFNEDCDNNLNESMDSNSLVIDESA